VLTTGYQWRMLPGDLPKWRTVHEYFAFGLKIKKEKMKVY